MADYSDYKECTDCVHYELCLHQEKFLIEHNRKDLIRRYGFGLSEPEICCNFRDRSRFVELTFEQNKGASPFDKVAHTTYTLATESHRVASFTIEGYYLMYNEERLYTLEKDGIVILVQGSSPHDVVEKAKLAIEKLSKERESNA